MGGNVMYDTANEVSIPGNKKPDTLHCAHCRKYITGQNSHKFLADLLPVPPSSDPGQHCEVRVLDAMARVVGIRLLATDRIVTFLDQLCICESCLELLLYLHMAYDCFSNENSYIVRTHSWAAEPHIPILKDNSTQTDFQGAGLDCLKNSPQRPDVLNDESQTSYPDADDNVEDAQDTLNPEFVPKPSPNILSQLNNSSPDPYTNQAKKFSGRHGWDRPRNQMSRRAVDGCELNDVECRGRLPYVRIASSLRRLADLKAQEAVQHNAAFFNRWYESMTLPTVVIGLTAKLNSDSSAMKMIPTDVSQSQPISAINQLTNCTTTSSLPEQKILISQLESEDNTSKFNAQNSMELTTNDKGAGGRKLRARTGALINYEEIGGEDDDGGINQGSATNDIESDSDEDFVPHTSKEFALRLAQDIFEDEDGNASNKNNNASSSEEADDDDIGLESEPTTEGEAVEVQCEYPGCSSTNLLFTLRGLSAHQLQTHGELTKTAEEAAAKAKAKIAKLRERRNKGRQWICEVESCRRHFTERKFLTRHGIVHLPVDQKREARLKLFEKSIKCDVVGCEERFGHSKTLAGHMKQCHPEKVSRSRKVKCEHPGCEKAYQYKSELKIHEESHLPPGERKLRFACPLCKKKWRTCSARNDHLIQIHSEVRNHLCTECGKTFKARTNLAIHLRTHTNERPHKCKKCGAGFKTPTALGIHASVHGDQRLMICETCGKGFKNTMNLSYHMIAHKNERLHKCPAPGCTADFNYKHHLMQHLTGSGNHGLDKEKVNRYLKNPESIQLFE